MKDISGRLVAEVTTSSLARQITPSADFALRPVKRIRAGLCWASWTISSAPMPAVPVEYVSEVVRGEGCGRLTACDEDDAAGQVGDDHRLVRGTWTAWHVSYIVLPW